MALPLLKPIGLSAHDFDRLTQALNRSLKLTNSISAIQTNAEGILNELKVTDEILKFLPEIKQELVEVEKKYRGEKFTNIVESCVEEIRTALNKIKEGNNAYDVE